MFYEKNKHLNKCKADIEDALKIWIETFENGGKLLCCGNGGSCADCDHIVGELMKGFMLHREVGKDFEEKLKRIGCSNPHEFCKNLQGALPAISLASHGGVISAFANDVNPEYVYAQGVYGYGNEGDVLLCLSTSGNSKNVVLAALCAKAKGLRTVAMTGERESMLSDICDVCIKVPETETYKIQELHLPIYHYLCAETEKYFFGKENSSVLK